MYSPPVVVLAFATAVLAAPFKSWIRGNADATRWNDILEQNFDIVQEIQDLEHTTVFVPTNGAMDDYYKAINDQPSRYGNLTADLIRYHALTVTLKYDELQRAGPFLPTLYNPGTVTGGQVIQFQEIGPHQTVYAYTGLNNNASLQDINFNIDNGHVLFINSVLTLPVSVEETANAAGLTSFAGAVVTSGVAFEGSDATWLAPINGAFQRVASALTPSSLPNILRYHSVTGGPLYSSDINKTTYPTVEGSDVTFTYAASGANLFFANSAAVLVANVLIDTGVMHIIDQVLNPSNTAGGTRDMPAFSSASPAPAPPYTQAAIAIPTSGYGFDQGSPHAPPGAIAGPAVVQAYTPNAGSKIAISLVVVSTLVLGSLVILL